MFSCFLFPALVVGTSHCIMYTPPPRPSFHLNIKQTINVLQGTFIHHVLPPTCIARILSSLEHFFDFGPISWSKPSTNVLDLIPTFALGH